MDRNPAGYMSAEEPRRVAGGQTSGTRYRLRYGARGVREGEPMERHVPGTTETDRRRNELEDLLAVRMQADVNALLTVLFASAGEDFAVPQDAVSGGLRTFHANVDTLRNRICRSELRLQLKGDFERSGPLLVSIMVADEYLSSHSMDVQATVGALIIKLGIDRVCAASDTPGRM